MLKTPAPFPQVGSWALLEEDGRTLAARIVLREGDTAAISVAGQLAASAARRVPLSRLANADPLTPAEALVLADLDRRFTASRRLGKAALARLDALGARLLAAAELQRLLAHVPARHFPAAAAARAA